MTSGRAYLTGLAVVTGSAGLLSVAGPSGLRTGMLVALGLTLAVQGPLGWWLVRAVGTTRLMPIWGIGIAARVSLFVLAAFVVMPLTGLAAEPFLFSLVGLLFAFLAVESVVLLVAPPTRKVA